MEDLVASVVIPVGQDAGSLGQCLDRVLRQDFGHLEVILVCDAQAAPLASVPKGSAELRVIREKKPCSQSQLINRGMCAARGHIKVLLMPHCVPVGNQWLRCLVEPFTDEEVGVVVSQCAMPEHAGGLPVRLMNSVAPRARLNRTGQLKHQRTVSHLCDAYRASLLADLGYFETDHLATPGEAIDVSLKIADAGYSILLSDAAAVTCNVPSAQQTVPGALRKALDYGYADALLDRMHDLRWLNSGVFSAAMVSLLLLPLAALDLPMAVICGAAVFVWGWFLSLRLPLVGWECPLAVVNFCVYGAAMLLIRDDWWSGVLGTSVHPAIIRQWAWLVSITGTYALLLLRVGLQATRRTIMGPRGLMYAPAVFLLAMLWWMLAGIGYLRALLPGRGRPS